MSDQEAMLTNRQGHPVRDNQNTITVGPKGPATLENYNFIEKLAHFDRERVPERMVHARGASAHGFVRSIRNGRRRAGEQVHPGKIAPDKGQANPGFRPLFDGYPQQRLARDPARPARLRGEVLYRRRQLGSRGQQSARLLHPRRDQVPRFHPLVQARPDHQSSGAEPPVRLHQPDPRINSHDHAVVQPARHSRELSRARRRRRQYLQARS
jgi:hypothetical protein